MKRDYITLEEVRQIVNSVMGFVFIEADGKKQYFPENLTVSANYCKLLYFAADEMKEEDKNSIETFYESCQAGNYNDILEWYSKNPQWQEINKYIEQKVGYMLSRMTNPLNLALAEFVDTINDVVIRNEDRMKDVDYEKVANGIAAFNENLNAEELVEAVLGRTEKKTPKKVKTTTKKSSKSNIHLAPKAEETVETKD